MSEAGLKRTPLHAAHLAAGARMAGFAGYDMPIQYPDGVMKEHAWTRESAGLFDVSHMGQAWLTGEGWAPAFEAVVPGDFATLKPGRQKYSVLLNDAGGILDDLMAARPDDRGLFLVVNGACKDDDFRFLEARLPSGVKLERLEDRALLALQGPQAAAVLAAHVPDAADLAFMDSAALAGFGGLDLIISRSGYTGEDGYEISMPTGQAEAIVRQLLADPRVAPVGLGARDTLRLEAGLPLHGQDITPTTTPVEAGLAFAIPRSRRNGGVRAGGFPGATTVLAQLDAGVARKLVGLSSTQSIPVRAHAVISRDAQPVGEVTSGTVSPSLGHPIMLAYVGIAHTAAGTQLTATVRDRQPEVTVTRLPFVPKRYKR